jgi:peptidyl-dipeptidase Dcp
LRDTIYAAGGSRDPADAYKAFRGRLPNPDALLRKRGLAEPAATT